MNDAAGSYGGSPQSKGAAHLREGRAPALEEVELAVHTAAALATYLSRKVSRGV